MDSQSGSLSKYQLSIGTTSINTAVEAFTRTPGAPPRLTDNFLFNSREKRLTQRGLNLWGWDSSHLRSENHLHVWSWDDDLLPPSHPLVVGGGDGWAVFCLCPFPLVSILRLTDFSCSAFLFLKVSFPFYSIIFRTISLISFQDMSSPPFEVSHTSDDNELITSRQEESVQLSGGWLEFDEV